MFEAMAEQAGAKGDYIRARRLHRRAEEPYLSLQELAAASINRTSPLFRELTSRLDLFCDFEVGTSPLRDLFKQSVPILFDHVSYFGLMQEAVFERLQWEATRAKDGNGSIIGDIGGDPVYAIGSVSFFLDFMALMNFEHESQTDYQHDEGDSEAL